MDITEIIEKYINADTQSRQEIEQGFGQSQMSLWSLIAFMSECAVLAVQQNDKSYIERGLYANVIEGCRQDYRDNTIALTKLYHSCLILKLNPDQEFQAIASKTNGEGKDLIVSFVKRKSESKTLKCMGLKTTLTPKFDFNQMDWDENYFKETEYSEPTDKELMAATNTGLVSCLRSFFAKRFLRKKII